MMLRLKTSSVLRIGMAALLLASLSKWFLPRSHALSPDLADGVTGFLYGVSIATLVLWMVMKNRRSAGGA